MIMGVPKLVFERHGTLYGALCDIHHPPQAPIVQRVDLTNWAQAISSLTRNDCSTPLKALHDAPDNLVTTEKVKIFPFATPVT